MTSYKGLYVQRNDDGEIDSVQVEDIGGVSIPLEPETYKERNIQPPIDELPDIDDDYQVIASNITFKINFKKAVAKQKTESKLND